jgi:hypothetical protein
MSMLEPSDSQAVGLAKAAEYARDNNLTAEALAAVT